jgi:hypothetical protein
MIGDRQAEVGMKFAMNVSQRRWNLHPVAHGKTQPVRLARSVVRVLTEHHHLDVGQRCELQRGKHLVGWRIHRVVATFVLDEVLQLAPVRELELFTQHRVPIGVHWAQCLA